jgi:putative sigma-54 modulation protein
MNISITARGGKASDNMKKYITDRIARKERVYEGVIETEVILSYEKLIQIAEIKAKVHNRQVFVKERSDDIYKSIDQALDSCERQIKRIKEKMREHNNEKISDKIAV